MGRSSQSSGLGRTPDVFAIEGICTTKEANRRTDPKGIEKRDGRVKARAVADGRSQVRYMEEETYSPTVKLESIMMCSLIDALEKRHVVTIDIKGAFLKAGVPNDLELIVRMEGELAELFED
jgi:hypothetical protein